MIALRPRPEWAARWHAAGHWREPSILDLAAQRMAAAPGKTAVIEGSVTTPDRRHLDRLFLAIQSGSGVASVRRKFNVSRLGPR